MPAYLNKLLHLGDRSSVYDALIRSIKGEEELPDEWRLDDALIVAGIHHRSEELLPVFWPGDQEPIFSSAGVYIPTLLSIAQSSPFPRVRSLAVTALPNLEGYDYPSFIDFAIPLELELRIILAAKLGRLEALASFVELLTTKSSQEGCWHRVSGPPLAVDYCVGRGGPFLYFPCGGKGESHQILKNSQLFDLLRIPFGLKADQHSALFHEIVGAIRPTHGLDDYVWRETEEA